MGGVDVDPADDANDDAFGFDTDDKLGDDVFSSSPVSPSSRAPPARRLSRMASELSASICVHNGRIVSGELVSSGCGVR
jgi:hypothetical protein